MIRLQGAAAPPIRHPASKNREPRYTPWENYTYVLFCRKYNQISANYLR